MKPQGSRPADLDAIILRQQEPVPDLDALVNEVMLDFMDGTKKSTLEAS